MLRWPLRAASALATLFRPLQDIDVYVEDVGAEAFYSELLNRLTDGKFRIYRVIPLGNRQAVEMASAKYLPGQRASIFICDGDLDWVRGDAVQSIPYLHRLGVYCIENFLICEKAAVEILVETDGALLRNVAAMQLGWQSWKQSMAKPLAEIFALFAAARKLAPACPSVSLGVGRLLAKAKRGQPQSFDSVLAAKFTAEYRSKIEGLTDAVMLAEEFTRVMDRISSLSDPLYAVSGKDFLLPLLRFHLLGMRKANFDDRSFKFRLARHCDLSPLQLLKRALHLAAQGKPCSD